MLKLFYLEGRPNFQAPLAQSPAQIDGNGVEMGDLGSKTTLMLKMIIGTISKIRNVENENLMKMIRDVENE
jgi:hypothetical protein